MQHRVFYAWQSDLDGGCTRRLIAAALERASRELGSAYQLDEAARDSPGSPDLQSTVHAKIDACAVFVPDLTLVGSTGPDRHTPNANVLIEYGYAYARIGAARIVPVLNTHFGTERDLPSDLRSQLVKVRFALAPDAPASERSEVEGQVARELQREIALVVDAALFGGLSDEARRAVEHFATTSLNGNRDPKRSLPDLAAVLGIEETVALGVVDELEGAQLLHTQRSGGIPLRALWPTALLFWTYDRLFVGWDPAADALHLAKMLARGSRREHQLRSDTTAAALRWSPRRMNPALTYLRDHGLAKASSTVARPFAVYSLVETSETRRFARGLLSP
ncbi:MAG: hypothetical protein AAF682_10815 [Planctomycetota bacterium]